MATLMLTGCQPSSAQDQDIILDIKNKAPMFVSKVCKEDNLVNGDYAVVVYDKIKSKDFFGELYLVVRTYMSYVNVQNNHIIAIWVGLDEPEESKTWLAVDSDYFNSTAPPLERFEGGEVHCKNGRYGALVSWYPNDENHSRELQVYFRREK